MRPTLSVRSWPSVAGLLGAGIGALRILDPAIVGFAEYPVTNGIILAWLFLVPYLTAHLYRQFSLAGAGRVALWLTAVLGLAHFCLAFMLSGVPESAQAPCGETSQPLPAPAGSQACDMENLASGSDSSDATRHLHLIMLVSGNFLLLHGLSAILWRIRRDRTPPG